MATFEIFMPALSSTMTEGKIVEWLKQPGDRVERGESVLVVESDKADMDVESFEAGFLGAVLLPAGHQCSARPCHRRHTAGWVDGHSARPLLLYPQGSECR